MWKICKQNVEQNVIGSEQESVTQNIVSHPETENEDVKADVPFTDEFLDRLPVEINGILYQTFEDDQLFDALPAGSSAHSTALPDFQPTEVLAQGEACQSVSGPSSEIKFDNLSRCDNEKDNEFSTEVRNLIEICESLETRCDVKSDCKDLLEIILQTVFKTVEEKQDIVIDAEAELTRRDTHNKINIISNIIVKKGKEQKQIEAIWKEHPHWPKQEDRGKKRKSREQMPFAITSRKWLEYQKKTRQ